jgi:hypothetical protein
VVAQILHATAAEWTSAVSSADPGDAETSAGWESVSGDHFSDNLMPWRNPRVQRRKFAFDDVQVGAANAASAHPEQELSRLSFGRRNVFNPQGRARNTGWSCEHCSFHDKSNLRRF